VKEKNMGISRFPHGIFATPNLGSYPLTCWKYGSRAWFVDGDLGGSGDGKSPDRAFLTITEAYNVASQYDTIYIITKAPNTSADSGKYYANLTIPITKPGLTFVGVGVPTGGRMVRMCGWYGVSGTASPVITAVGEGLGLENIKLNQNTSNTYGVYGLQDGGATSDSSGFTAWNCRFGGSASYAAIYLTALQGATIRECDFVSCVTGVDWRSAAATAAELLIEDCRFSVTAPTGAASVKADIYVYTQGSMSMIINRCLFNHLIPSGGSPNRWIWAGSDVINGLVSNCMFAGENSTAYTCGPTGTGVLVGANVGTSNLYDGTNALMVHA